MESRESFFGTHLNEVAFRYRDGKGVPKDANIAFEFFSKSAALGDDIAQIELGA